MEFLERDGRKLGGLELIGLFLVVVLGLFVMRSGKPRVLRYGAIKMRVGRMFWLAASFFIVSFACIAFFLVPAEFSFSRNTVLWLMFVFSALLPGVYLILVGSNVYVILSETGVTNRTMFGKVKSMSWKDVISVDFSLVGGWFVLKDNLGVKIYVSVVMMGIKEFTDYIRGHTQPKIHETALKTYRTHYWYAR